MIYFSFLILHTYQLKELLTLGWEENETIDETQQRREDKPGVAAIPGIARTKLISQQVIITLKQ